MWANARVPRRFWRVTVDPQAGIIASGFALLYPTMKLIRRFASILADALALLAFRKDVSLRPKAGWMFFFSFFFLGSILGFGQKATVICRKYASTIRIFNAFIERRLIDWGAI